MQKYLNIDPMDGGGTLLQESTGLLGTGGDEEAPSVLALQPMSSGQDAGSATTPTGAVTRTPMFGAPAPNVSSGYVPPDSYEASEEGVSNPMSAQSPLGAQGSRYTVPTIPMSTGPAPSSGPPSASAAAASKNKKAMKEPKSMRSST